MRESNNINIFIWGCTGFDGGVEKATALITTKSGTPKKAKATISKIKNGKKRAETPSQKLPNAENKAGSSILKR